MIEIIDGNWIADLNNKKCRNLVNGVIVAFEKSGKFYRGKVEYIPDELMAEWANGLNGAKKIENAVLEAEEVYMKAFFQTDIEKNGIRKEWMKKDQ